MLALDRRLHHEELNRVILRVMHMADIDAAIDKIRAARPAIESYQTQDETQLQALLGEQVVTDQPEARMAAIFSTAGWGGLIIDRYSDTQGFRHLSEAAINAIISTVASPPVYRPFDDAEEWFRYYLGAEASGPSIEGGIVDLLPTATKEIADAGLKLTEGLLHRFIASLLTKRFVILTGLSGSGKTKLAQAFSSWLGEATEEHKDPFYRGAEVKSDKISYFIEESGPVGVVFRNKAEQEGATRVGLPRALINEWVAVMKSRGFSKNTPAREIREAVAKTTSFSTQLNSFETHLKAAALALIKAGDLPKELGDSVTLVSVGADWDNNEQLLGYADALRVHEKAYCKPANGALELILRARRPENSNRPFFLILDEMNLSHVERYFADFLSAMESGSPLALHAGPGPMGERGEVPARPELPDNFFVIGTVNIDETTYLFSPKVLDRANTIEFRVSKADMDQYLEGARDLDLSPLMGRGARFGEVFISAARQRDVGVERLTFSENKEFMALLPDEALPYTGGNSPLNRLSSDLLKTFDSLAEVGAEYGYRAAAEMRRFFYYYTLLAPGESKYTVALDAQVIQKLLPKLHGSVRKLDPVLEALLTVCGELNLTLSVEKIERMRRNLKNNGFTSFAEA